MVVVCESCSTRFQLDEARIPPKGTLVRCSRCKATFIVRRPATSFEATVEDVVAEVTQADGPPVPEPAEDLFDRPSDDLGETQRRAESDDNWEFDDTPAVKSPSTAPSFSIPASPAHPMSAEPPAPPAPATTAPPVDEIGSPEEWDLLGDSVADTASQATFVEPEPTRPVRQEVRPSAPPPRVETPRIAFPERSAGGLVGAAARAGRTALRTTAWLALAAISAFGVAQVVPRGAAHVAPVAHEVIRLADGEARGVRVRFLENAFAGTLFVVQGELARGTADPALGLRVHFVDAAGARLGGAAWARPVPELAELRERAPESLRAEPPSGPPPAPREGAFAAVFDAVPAGATGVDLALEPLPARPLPVPTASGAPEPAAAPGAAGATASSPPSLPPSSE